MCSPELFETPNFADGGAVARNNREPQAAANNAIPTWLTIANVALAGLLVTVLILALFTLASPTPDQRDILRILTAVLDRR